MLSVQPALHGNNDFRVGRKMATFQLFFQSREEVVVRRGQIRRIGWVIKTLEAQVGQFLLGSCSRQTVSIGPDKEIYTFQCNDNEFHHVEIQRGIG